MVAFELGISKLCLFILFELSDLGPDRPFLGFLELVLVEMVFSDLVSLENSSSESFFESVFLDSVFLDSAFSNTLKVVSAKTHERVQTCQLIKPNLTSEVLPL